MLLLSKTEIGVCVSHVPIQRWLTSFVYKPFYDLSSLEYVLPAATKMRSKLWVVLCSLRQEFLGRRGGGLEGGLKTTKAALAHACPSLPSKSATHDFTLAGGSAAVAGQMRMIITAFKKLPACLVKTLNPACTRAQQKP